MRYGRGRALCRRGDALVTKSGNYATWLRVDGMQRMAERKDFDAINEAMRLDLSGAFETRGHAIVGWYISDPDAALVEIERLNLVSCRNIAQEVGLDLHDILEERAKLWPKLMRWEAAYLILWTRTSVLTREERKQLKAEYAAAAKELGAVGKTQRVYLRSEVMAARHEAFTTRVLSALRAHDIAAAAIDPHEALGVARSAMYREMAGSEWTPCLPGDRVMARCPEEDVQKPKAEYLLWPPVREQIFYADAVTQGGQRVDFGDNSYAPVDMNIGPEDPRPFVELAAVLGRDRIPWRASIVLEGSGQSAMSLKDVGASFLSMFPGKLRPARPPCAPYVKAAVRTMSARPGSRPSPLSSPGRAACNVSRDGGGSVPTTSGCSEPPVIGLFSGLARSGTLLSS